MLPQVTARLKEYPFLGRYADVSRLQEIKVSRMDPDFLRQAYYEHHPIDSEYPTWACKRYLLLNVSGDLLAEVGWDHEKTQRMRFELFQPATWRRPHTLKRCPGEQIHNALDRLGLRTDEVRWGLRLESSSEFGEKLHDTNQVWAMHLYDLPTGYESLLPWVMSLQLQPSD